MFQYQAIDRLPQAPTVWTLKGTLVHAALEGLFALAPAARSVDAALASLDEATRSPRIADGFASLELDDGAVASFTKDAVGLVRRYFELEDPRDVDAVGVELRLEMGLELSVSGQPLQLRGVIDRLDRTEAGDLVVVDYKTGRAPGPGHERSKMAGVETYALMCERVLGVRPVAVRLLYLAAPLVVEREIGPSEVGRQERRTLAVWQAITKAHATGAFRPSPGPLCNYCSYSDRCESAQTTAAGLRRASGVAS
jgi:putative RecB family exonuclease